MIAEKGQRHDCQYLGAYLQFGEALDPWLYLTDDFRASERPEAEEPGTISCLMETRVKYVLLSHHSSRARSRFESLRA